MSVTRRDALRVQAEGPRASWWPSADQPEWARVTPGDLRPVDLAGEDADELDQPALWTLSAYDEEREEATYELCLDTLDGPEGPLFVCRDAGTSVKFRDDLTFATGADAQPLALWFAWLQRRDALMAAQPVSDEWGGDDVDMQLSRAEADIVAMGEQTALLSVFNSVAAVRDWAERLTPRPLVPLEVYAFDAAGWQAAARAGGEEKRSFHQFHETSDDDGSEVVVKWLPVPVDAASAQSWFALADGRQGPAYVSGYSGAGGEVSAFAVERAIAWGEMVPFLTEEFAGVEVAAPEGAGRTEVTETEAARDASGASAAAGDDEKVGARWIAVRFAGMPSGIALPCDGTFVTFTTDGDGASFVVTGEFADVAVARRRAEQEFRLRWARWYDTDEPLQPDALARGLAAIDATMKELA